MTTGLYVFGEYIKRLQTLFQQNKVNVSFSETFRLIARNHSVLKVVQFIVKYLHFVLISLET